MLVSSLQWFCYRIAAGAAMKDWWLWNCLEWLFTLLQPAKQAESDDEVIVTSVGFADRQASLEAAVGFDTEKAIADLYAHVAQMPDSSHKRRLMKQVGCVCCGSHFCAYLDIQGVYNSWKTPGILLMILENLTLS